MQTIIRKGLQKNPVALIDEMVGQVASPEARVVVRATLEAIARNLALEVEKTDERKALSRQIGVAKRSNKDSTGLIHQVSLASAQIDKITNDISAQMTVLELQINQNLTTDKDSLAPAPALPQHLQHDEDCVKSAGTNQILTISHKADIDPEVWQQFVDSTDHSTIYHDVRWKQLVERNFKHDLYCITCKDHNDSLIGILPLVHLKSALFGSFTISMPFFNYGGPLALNAEAEQALMTHAAKLSDDLGCSHMEIRETRTRSGWQSTQRKVSMILPLPTCDDILDANLGAKLRAQVNKARKHEITVAFGGLDLLDSFYRVFSRNMRDLGTPVYSKAVFRDILATFPDNAFLAIASQNGSPLAVGFLLGHKDKLEIPWASSIRSKNHLGANMLMYRELLKEAIRRKYRYFDFGRSTKEAATHRFKKQWGAKEHDLHWHYWTRGGEAVPELNPDNPKFKIAIRLWQLLPVALTRIIGPPVARNLP